MKTRWTLSVARTSALVVLAGLLAAPLSANIEVIYTKIPGHPTAAVPGALALNGNPLASDFRALEDLFLSPDGSMWMVKGRTQAIPDEENILILGSGLSGTMFSQEGQPIPGGAANEIVDFFGSAIGQFNANNDFVYTVRARGGVASVFQKVVVYDGTNHCVVWQMGDLYTGLVDVLANPSGDETIGNSIGSVHITNAGRVGAQDSTILNIHTSKRPAIFYADYMGCQPASPSFHMFQQTNETTVIPLGGGAPVLWKTLTANGFFTSLDGSRWLTRGQIVGPPTTSDDVLAVDGQVVIQEGTPLPGDPSIMVNSIVVAFFGADNQWYARGTTAGGGVWAVREGQLIAKTGSPVTPCGGENWGTAFLALAANGVGDWVLVGSTDNPNAGADNVMVLNGQSVVVREGDSVDIPGWGEAKIGRANNTLVAFEANDVAIDDDGLVYFFASLNDGAGNDLNSSPAFGTPQAFMRVKAAKGACATHLNPLANYGRLNQRTINPAVAGRPAKLGSYACGPVAAANSFTFLEKTFPECFDRMLVPHDQNFGITANDINWVAVLLAQAIYMDAKGDTTATPTDPADFPDPNMPYDPNQHGRAPHVPMGGGGGGVTWEKFWSGKKAYVAAVGAAGVTKIEGHLPGGPPRPGLMVAGNISAQDIAAKVVAQCDVEIGFTWVGSAGGHYVTVYGFDYLDANGNGSWDAGEAVTHLYFIDPWGPGPALPIPAEDAPVIRGKLSVVGGKLRISYPTMVGELGLGEGAGGPGATGELKIWVSQCADRPDCPGDVNGDGMTNQADLGMLLADFGCNAGVGNCPGDLNGDGQTNQADLGILLGNFGCGTP